MTYVACGELVSSVPNLSYLPYAASNSGRWEELH